MNMRRQIFSSEKQDEVLRRLCTAECPTPIVDPGASFTPVWDQTDHFHFKHDTCKRLAVVYDVEMWSDSAPVCPCIYFHLICPDCGNSGQRKIYLNQEKDARASETNMFMRVRL